MTGSRTPTQAEVEELRELKQFLFALTYWKLSTEWALVNGHYRPVLTADDLFFSAGPVSVALTVDRLPLLQQSMLDAGGPEFGVPLFICRCRRESPGRHWAPKIPPGPLTEHFAACDKPRDVPPLIDNRHSDSRAPVDPAISHPGQFYGPDVLSPF